jgi:ribosomal protein L2
VRTPASYERRDWGDVPIEKQFDSLSMLGLGVYVRRLIGSNGSIIANARGAKALIAFFVSNIAILVAPSGALLFLSSRIIAYEALGCASHYAQPLAIKGRIWHAARVMRSRWRRPIVRGIVKNPCDHPHGGRSKAIESPRTP